MLEVAVVDSPVGPLTTAAHDGRLCALWFGARADVEQMLSRWYPDEAVHTAADPAGAVTALAAYFSGALGALDGVPIELNGTAFQRRVWERLRSVQIGRASCRERE